MSRGQLAVGSVIWVDLSPAHGREQRGRRPAIVVSSVEHLEIVRDLVIVVPCTTRDRGWPNHVKVEGATGLSRDCWAMTEQPRTISRDRISAVTGQADSATVAEVATWLRDWLTQPAG